MRRLSVILALVILATSAGVAWADSIWERRVPEAYMFEDYRARRLGDLVTIIVSESTEFEAMEKKELNKETKTGASYSFKGSSSGDSTSKSFSADIDGQGASQRKFDAKNNSSIDRRFLDRMTLTVVAVYPNGVIAVEGYRQRILNKEVRMLRVRGFVRPADIGPNNTVQSQFLANFEVSYIGKGPESSYTNHGWWGKVLNVIWPY